MTTAITKMCENPRFSKQAPLGVMKNNSDIFSSEGYQISGLCHFRFGLIVIINLLTPAYLALIKSDHKDTVNFRYVPDIQISEGTIVWCVARTQVKRNTSKKEINKRLLQQGVKGDK